MWLVYIVNKVLLDRAGSFYKDECIRNGIPKPGQAMLTAGRWEQNTLMDGEGGGGGWSLNFQLGNWI